MEYGSITTATTTDYLEDLFSSQNTEVDVGMEWLSVFVEDCFSSRGNCLPAPAAGKPTADAAAKPSQQPSNSLAALEKFAVAGKARSKRKRVAAAESGGRAAPSTWFLPSPDPPLLDQAYWMADSELLGPKRNSQQESQRQQRSPEQEQDGDNEGEEREGDEKVSGKSKLVILAKSKVVGVEAAAARRCSHCLSQRTPQWRAGPMGPKTLCNACGVRYKSGRLLPEYRPAKSPTFVSYLHSNSHRKVLEMRGSGTEVSADGRDGGVSGGGRDGGISTTAVEAAGNV